MRVVPKGRRRIAVSEPSLCLEQFALVNQMRGNPIAAKNRSRSSATVRREASYAKAVREMPKSSTNSRRFVPVDGQGTLDASRMNRVEPDDYPDLPYAWKAFPHGARAPLRSLDGCRHIL